MSLMKMGASIKRHRGSWQYGDNLSQFNQNLAAGMSESQAALNTKTGGYARAFLRFKNARVIIGTKDPLTGTYPLGVEVEFTP